MGDVYANRHECKFVVDEGTATRLLRQLGPFLRPDAHAAMAADHAYMIASLYLDDDNRTLARETLGGIANRFKLRVRAYDDSPSSPVFLEVKRRADRTVQKIRAPIARHRLADLLACKPSALAELRSAARANAEEFLALMQTRTAHPVLQVRYRREAYVGRDDDEVRVTFDRRLATCPCAKFQVRVHDDAYQPIAVGGVVLELKFTDQCPRWMLEAIEELELLRVSFSKYNHSLTTLNDARQKVESA